MQPTVERVIFQFSDRCNMKCPYCYCRFVGLPVEASLCRAIVERCRNLGTQVLTFTGGDPFVYRSFRELVTYSASLGFEVQVDTNGLAMRAADYGILNEAVSLLSLPVDGSTPAANAEMRGMIHHLEVVLRHLEGLMGERVRTKINTTVAQPNISNITAIGDLLAKYRIETWSLFQFWPLHDAADHCERFEISSEDYHRVIAVTRDIGYPFRIESGTIDDRVGNHFFVTHQGEVYTHDPADTTAYLVLGSIFDDSTIDTWQTTTGSSVHPEARARYRSLRAAP